MTEYALQLQDGRLWNRELQRPSALNGEGCFTSSPHEVLQLYREHQLSTILMYSDNWRPGLYDVEELPFVHGQVAISTPKHIPVLVIPLQKHPRR